MDASEVIADRRQYPSRRVFSWSTALFGFLRSHRRTLRRVEDADSLFTDWHHPWLFFLAVGIMVLSCADAFMTLLLLEHGMVEANPIMAAMLDQGIGRFSTSKFALTGICVLTLVFLARTAFMNLMRTGLLLTFFFSIYCCLVCYQFVHLLRVL